MKLITYKISYIVIWLNLVFITSFILFAISAFNAVSDHINLVNRSYKVMIQTARILEDVDNYEISRNFTGSIGSFPYLGPDEKSIKSVNEELAILKTLTGDREAQSHQVDSMSLYIDRWVNLFYSVQSADKLKDEKTASLDFERKESTLIIERLRHYANQVQVNENTWLHQKELELEKATTRAGKILRYLVISIVVLVILLLFRLRNRRLTRKISIDNESDHIAPIQTVKSDKTLRKKAEEKLELAEMRYRRLFDTAKDGILILDAGSGAIIDANKFILDLLGYSFAEIKGKYLWEIGLLKNIIASRESFRKLQREGYIRYADQPLETKSGHLVWVEFISNVYVFNGEKLIQCNIRDITKRKETEMMLDENREKIKRIIDNLPVGILSQGHAAEILFSNEQALVMLGLTKDQLLGKTSFDPDWNVIHEDGSPFPGNEHPVPKAVATKRPVKNVVMGVYRPLTRDRVWLLVNAEPDLDREGNLKEVMCSFTDITELKKAEDELKKAKREIEQSEIKFSAIINQATEGIALADLAGRYKFVNSALCTMTGYQEDELLELTVFDLTAPSQPKSIFFESSRAKQGIPVEVRLRRKDGSEFMTEIIGRVIVIGGRQFVLGVVRDITERIKAEEEIRQSNERFEFVARATNDIVWDWNLLNDSLWWNNNYYRIFGYEKVEATLDISHWKNNIYPEDKARITASIYKEFNNGAQYWQDEYKYRCNDGRFRFVYDRGFILRDENGKPYRMIGSMQDITERIEGQEKLKETTEQLRHLTVHLQTIREEERKRIGREIHDELGQQLTAIKMDVAWIDKKIDVEDRSIKDKLKDIITLLDGSNASVRKILNELRPSLLDDLDLGEAMQWQGQQFTESTGINVVFSAPEMNVKLPEETATCIFRVYQESLTNIMRYAQASKVSSSLKIENNSVILTVEDDGKGFDLASVQKKKSFGILGMKERVYSQGGHFELTTSPGKGTKIFITVPFKL